MATPWFANICNYVAASHFPLEASRAYKDKIQSDTKYYIWDDPYLWRLCSDKVIRRCTPDTEINSVLQLCHSAPGGSHYGSITTTRKVLDCGLYWPTIFRDAYHFVSTCEKCQKAGMAMNRRHEMPQQPILFCEVFDVWGIDFMGPFPVSNGYSYILLVVDYVSRWVEAVATKTNDTKVVVDFLKSNIFRRFGVPKALISDQGSHFYNRAMASLLQKYGVEHRIATAYHPQTNGQAEVFNREIKKTLQKMTNPSRKDWSRLLEDALWAHRTAYRTSLGMSPYWVVFGKTYHLLVELGNKAYWAVKQCNLAYDQAGDQRKFQLQELDELRLEAYENSRIYKQNVKKFHDQKILRKDFHLFQKVLVFNSQLKLIAGKLHSRWDGPFVITNIFPNGAVQLQDEHRNSTFQVNGHQIKSFHEGPAPTTTDMEIISLMEPTPPDVNVLSAESLSFLFQSRIPESEMTLARLGPYSSFVFCHVPPSRIPELDGQKEKRFSRNVLVSIIRRLNQDEVVSAKTDSISTKLDQARLHGPTTQLRATLVPAQLPHHFWRSLQRSLNSLSTHSHFIHSLALVFLRYGGVRCCIGVSLNRGNTSLRLGSPNLSKGTDWDFRDILVNLILSAQAIGGEPPPSTMAINPACPKNEQTSRTEAGFGRECLSALNRDQAGLSLLRSSRLSLCRERLGQCRPESMILQRSAISPPTPGGDY
ncbi:gag-pol, partial [Mucuna pruriens]